MQPHPSESWFVGMDRDQLVAWAAAHAAWSVDAWTRGDADAWLGTFRGDVRAHIRRGIGPESYRGRDDLMERAWGLHEFFPRELASVVEVIPPSVVLYRILMRNEDDTEVGILIAHRIDEDGLVAEFVVYDDDAPPGDVNAGVAELARHHEP